jgi:hypothetical protein
VRTLRFKADAPPAGRDHCIFAPPLRGAPVNLIEAVENPRISFGATAAWRTRPIGPSLMRYSSKERETRRFAGISGVERRATGAVNFSDRR